MITKNKRYRAAGVGIALLVLAGCGSGANTSNPVATAAGSGTTTESDGPTTTATPSTDVSPGSTSSTTTVPGGSGEAAEFEGDFPPPEGSTLRGDGFAIGGDGPRKAEFNISGSGGEADAVNAYKTTLEAAGFTISREQPGRAYVAEKGDLQLQITARKDLYEVGLVILSVIYQTIGA